MRDLGDRLTAVQTPGGCGAVRLGAEVIFAAAPDCDGVGQRSHLACPYPADGLGGAAIQKLSLLFVRNPRARFYRHAGGSRGRLAGDIVSTARLLSQSQWGRSNAEQWQALATFMAERALVPMIDFAYQGMGAGLSEDAPDSVV